MNREEYERRFKARIIEKVDDGDTLGSTLEDIAKSEYEGLVDCYGPPDDERNTMRKIQIRLEFNSQDFWIGAYWKSEDTYWRRHIWICILPFIPIHISWEYTPKFNIDPFQQYKQCEEGHHLYQFLNREGGVWICQRKQCGKMVKDKP